MASQMKCFFHEALTYFGYSTQICVIDNTSLAISRGSGSQAIFASEMADFAKDYGFTFKAHEIGHSDRKAGCERNFWSLETNFFPGRTFKNLGDLNKQVFEWATERYARRPQARTKLIPMELFDIEKPYLNELPVYIHPPYIECRRKIDQYGYVAMDANYYLVPGQKTQHWITVLQYPETLTLYPPDACEITYTKAGEDVKNERIKPDGYSGTLTHQPRNRKKKYDKEELWLRHHYEACHDYLDFIHSQESIQRYKGKFIRNLYNLARQIPEPVFLKTIKRALKYKTDKITSIEAIARHYLKDESSATRVDIPIVSQDFKNRPMYQKGRLSLEKEYE
jgi:hypothetical protein